MSPRAVQWWRLRALVLMVVLTTPQVLVLLPTGAPAAMWTFPVVTVLATAAYALVVPGLRYRIHRWEVTDEAVYTRSGWLTREWRIAPISRVQTVDTQHGPLQQLLKLATVTVTTASARGAVTIAGLDATDAAELARSLTATTQATPGDAT